ncbi:hypothetical protein K7711_38875 [Nocardia sp. CA2R105]|uniref:hypothetical protein n=1 Tax=Nocardia coffeae TaxID=2873381 RepID=UPI001CA6B344|nr:hypothetical protein [Nocardia coffeae]MBY8862488.1 hypothetical protein [Nocardia coffeae]
MFHRQSVRTLIIALSGGVILTLGAATAVAEPQGNPDYPLGAQNEAPGHPETGDADSWAERAEDVGGAIVTQIIDTSANLTKCVVSLVTPSVSCG